MAREGHCGMRTRAGEPEPESMRTFLAMKKLSDLTKYNYRFRIDQYLRWIGKDPDTFVRETANDPKAFEKQFIAFLGEEGRGKRPTTVAFIRDSLKKFLEINRVGGIDWRYISEFVPQRKRYGDDRAPTVEEIRRLLSAADLRMRCLILFLASSGARIGSIRYLRWRDISPVKTSDGLELARVVIYRGEPEQYATFVTPEAYSQLLEYQRMRTGLGERVGPDSFVFVNTGNVDNFRPEMVRPITVGSMKNLLRRTLRQLSMRSTIYQGTKYRNFEFKQAHGFRKFFKTRMEMSGVKPIITEMLMGHALGVSSSYMKPVEAELVEEYAKAVKNLTMSEARQGMSRDDVVATFNRQFLKLSRYADEEIDAMGDISQLTPEQLTELQDRKKMESMGLENGSTQKVVPLREIKAYVVNGWEYVTALPEGEAVIRLPARQKQ
jgi:integrase